VLATPLPASLGEDGFEDEPLPPVLLLPPSAEQVPGEAFAPPPPAAKVPEFGKPGKLGLKSVPAPPSPESENGAEF